MAKKKAAPKDEVAIVEETTTAVAIAEDNFDYGDMAGAGMKDITREDLAIPFLTMLQAGSKRVKDPDDEAQAGQLLNSVTGQLFPAARKDDEGALFVPAFMTRAWVEWAPGNKFVGIRSTKVTPTDDPETMAAIESAEKFGKNKLANGNLVVYTIYLNGFIIESVGDTYGTFAMLPFKSTQHKKLKPLLTNLNTHMIPVGPVLPNGSRRRINPPMFANQLRIKSTTESYADGDSFGYDITFAVDGDIKKSLLPARVDGVANELFQMALDFEKSFTVEELAASADKAGGDEVSVDEGVDVSTKF